MSITERKQELIEACLEVFIKKGLSETSVRDLSKEINLNSAGLYWHFSNKDDVVVACAEEAALKLERYLISETVCYIEDPDKLINVVYERCAEMKPVMKFFASVCALTKYEEAMLPVLNRLTGRYHHYAEIIAKKLNVQPEDIESYLYTAISTMICFMLFGGDVYVAPQINDIKKTLEAIVNKQI